MPIRRHDSVRLTSLVTRSGDGRRAGTAPLDREPTTSRLICVHDSVAAYSHLTRRTEMRAIADRSNARPWSGWRSSRRGRAHSTAAAATGTCGAATRRSAGRFTFSINPVGKAHVRTRRAAPCGSAPRDRHGVSVPRLITSDRRGGRGLRLSRGTLMTVALTRSTLPMTDLTTLVRTVAASPELW